MKILIVIDDYFNQSNGMCISTQRFAHEYRKMGQEVRILSTGKDADYPVPELKIYIPIIYGLIKKQGFHFAKPISKTLQSTGLTLFKLKHLFLYLGARPGQLKNEQSQQSELFTSIRKISPLRFQFWIINSATGAL